MKVLKISIFLVLSIILLVISVIISVVPLLMYYYGVYMKIPYGSLVPGAKFIYNGTNLFSITDGTFINGGSVLLNITFLGNNTIRVDEFFPNLQTDYPLKPGQYNSDQVNFTIKGAGENYRYAIEVHKVVKDPAIFNIIFPSPNVNPKFPEVIKIYNTTVGNFSYKTALNTRFDTYNVHGMYITPNTINGKPVINITPFNPIGYYLLASKQAALQVVEFNNQNFTAATNPPEYLMVPLNVSKDFSLFLTNLLYKGLPFYDSLLKAIENGSRSFVDIRFSVVNSNVKPYIVIDYQLLVYGSLLVFPINAILFYTGVIMIILYIRRRLR
ncbi:conserved protein [Sulfolobus acidocaldarius DSM 639]|uniref:Conserved protein n=1 Tax=Sulfolobus acidocaldarius (strain ATCC 33909 / DSM 639 / JCM 8929 / NBRC 15157 / NCIMB 11770) TaxID=330779 RepID=Q4J7D0_SULAC|nr:conserved protein [Sulfolobus acidocaldarius DSM 639]